MVYKEKTYLHLMISEVPLFLETPIFQGDKHNWLVFFPTHLKKYAQVILEIFTNFAAGGSKKTNIWNHHLDSECM